MKEVKKDKHSMAYHTLWTHSPWKTNGHRFDTHHHSFLELSGKLLIRFFFYPIRMMHAC